MISNPGSGHNRDRFGALEARIDACTTIRHRITRSAADIEPALRDLQREGIRALAVNGGDGTASAVLGCLLEQRIFDIPPPVILLPGGTANMNAGDVGMRAPLDKAVRRLCRWAGAGEPPRAVERRAIMRVAGGGSAPRYGMFLGAGAVIHGTEYAHEEIHSRGLRDDFSLALGTARTVWGVLRGDPRFNRHVEIDLAANGQPARRFDTLILAVSTLQRLSFGMRPFFGSGEGAIRCTVFEQGCTRFARTFVSIVRGRPNRNATPESGYHSFNTDTLTLRMDGRLNLDGELFDCRGELALSASEPLEFLQL